MELQQKYHYVLVHGACHGAWCWYKLIDRLEKGGHQVTALDMASAGQHPADPNTIATFEQYNQPLTDFFRSLAEDDPSKVVLIGHSLAGLTCMLLMEQFSHKIGLMIHVASVITPNGASVLNSGKLTELDVVLASFLVRPYPIRMLGTPISHTQEKYGQVPVVYIKYLRDSTMPVSAQNWITENIGPFKEVVEIDGGHFHFHTKIDDFTQLVYRLTENYFTK